MTSKFVLDSSAFLAFARREPGGDRVQAILQQSVLSAVNVSEIIHVLQKRGFTPQEAMSHIAQFNLDIRDFTFEQAIAAAKLDLLTQQFGLSFGDRACLALAQQMNLPVVTADQIWSKLNLGIRVDLIRPNPVQ